MCRYLATSLRKLFRYLFHSARSVGSFSPSMMTRPISPMVWQAASKVASSCPAGPWKPMILPSVLRLRFVDYV